MKKLNIVFCIDAMAKGGAERVLSVLVNEFSKKNNVTIITSTLHPCDYKLNDNVELYCLENIEYQKLNKIFYFFCIVPRYIKKIIRMRKKFDDINPDVIISFLPASSFFSVIANRRKYKLIICDRSDPKIEYSGKLNYLLMKYTYPKADGFVFQTTEAKEYFNNILDFSKIKSIIMYNPIDAEFVDEERWIYKNKKNIISIGRIDENKNHLSLIEAFKMVQKDYPNCNLTIYGDGPLRKTLQAKVKNEKINNVKLPGIENNIKSKLLENDIFVLTSKFEGMPNALLEAMCLGLPVISTDCPCGGPREIIINGKNGLLVNVDDVDDLYNALIKYIKDERLMIKCANEAQKISKFVRVESVIKIWYDFIETIIK